MTTCPHCGKHVGKVLACSYDECPLKPRQPDNEMNELLMETIVRGQNKPDIYERVNRMQIAQEEIERAARGEPAQPDTSARDAAAEEYARARSGSVSDYEVLGSAWLAGHARASEEMGAEVNRLTYELDKSRDSHMRQLAAAELKAAAYEKALELIREKSPRCDCMDAPGIACEVLAAHRTGEK